MSKPLKFNVGDLAPGNIKIAFIYGQTDSIMVYRDGEYGIQHYIDRDELSDQDHEALTRHHYLRSRVFDILPKTQWQNIVDDLATALYHALTAAKETLKYLVFPSSYRSG